MAKPSRPPATPRPSRTIAIRRPRWHGIFTALAISGLRDVAEASYGPAPSVQDTVHGPDDRVQINTTAAYPWLVHASLLITAADDSLWLGTGWFIGPHTLMTAGHVVYIKNSGVPGRDGWVQTIQVMPAMAAACRTGR
jgi:glutamyl endopeptidase